MDASTTSCELSTVSGSMPTMPTCSSWYDDRKYRFRKTTPWLCIWCAPREVRVAGSGRACGVWSPTMTYEAADHTRSLPDPAKAACARRAKTVADRAAMVCFNG